MRILFHMTSKYPTSKAYGVTTGESARALRELGHQVRIVSPCEDSGGLEIDDYGNEVLKINTRKLLLIRGILDKVRYIGTLSFIVVSGLYSFKARKFTKVFSPDALWTRDALSALTLLNGLQNLSIIVEIHQPPSILSRVAIRILNQGRSTILLVIQESHKSKLQKKFPKCKVIFAPMGVNSDFIAVGKAKLASSFGSDRAAPIRVCYVGRMHSSGIDNGLRNLVNNWNLIAKEEATLTIIGLSQMEISLLPETSKKVRIEYVYSTKHSKIPELLTRFDCGIIPYTSSEYNDFRFPIKAVEYCATGLNIVLTKNRSHMEILDDNIGYFYDPNDALTLAQCIAEVKQNRTKAFFKAKNGYSWAKRYTYINRVNPVVRFLEGL